MTKCFAIALLIALVPTCALAYGPWISPIGLATPEPQIESPSYGPWISPIGLAPTLEPQFDAPQYGPWISPIGNE